MQPEQEHAMNLDQLTGRHVRLRRELLSTYRSLPRDTGRIARLTHELAATERMISMARAAVGAVTGSMQSGNRSRTSQIDTLAGVTDHHRRVDFTRRQHLSVVKV